MREYLQSLPKAELHLHLEGSIDAGTLAAINPALDPAEIEARYHYNTFLEFLQNFGWVARNLQTPEHYAIATRHLLRKLAAQNVRYVELTLAVGVLLWKKQDVAAVHQAVREAAAASDVEVWWIWDAVRQWGVEAAGAVAELAVKHRDDGVVAFGLGGDETSGPAREFADVFTTARRGGLHLVCHAGEWMGPDSVWQALEVGAERIGHGVRSIEDPALVRHLADQRIPLEACPVSNVRTGSIISIEEHPLRRLFDAGVPITLNTDDPPMFGTDLLNEYETAARVFGFSEQELAQVAANGFAFAFMRS
ncbi:MAG: adenosine deaminase [Bryobacterales bacterium]|nr:adenosine deaminase [Bryobacterales bacterium]